MPLSIRVDPSTDVVHIDGSGAITLEDIIRLIEDLAAAAELVRGRNGIIDTAQMTESTLTFDAIRRISDRVSRFDELFRGTRWAVVAPSDMLYGLARIYETLRLGGSFEFRTFRHAADAFAWLRAERSAL